MINNEGKTALVFGVRNDASLSFLVAKKLHASGCKVGVSYIKESENEVLPLLEKSGLDTSMAYPVDIRNEDEIESFVKSVYEQTGAINYILHGIAHGDHQVMCSKKLGENDNESSYLDIPFDSMMDSFNISAYSLLRICRVAAPYLKVGDASILTLTYNASQRVFKGYAGMGINKAALENIMLYLADHFGEKSIRVNAISAGLVMTTSSGGIKGVRTLRKIGKTTAPLGNITSEDVGNAAMYYFSDLSKKTTGNIHYVDGGFNIMGVNEI
ncbi:MAG: SDR family oxidoreductase [Cyclobacteriaceae bacterium]